MQRYRIAFALLIFGATPGLQAAGKPKPKVDKTFVRTWHGCGMVAAGYCRRLVLKGDGSYLMYENQMDYTSRLYWGYGQWGLVGKTFYVRELAKKHIVGGKQVCPPKNPTCDASEKAWRGHNDRTTLIKKPSWRSAGTLKVGPAPNTGPGKYWQFFGQKWFDMKQDLQDSPGQFARQFAKIKALLRKAGAKRPKPRR